MNTAKLAPKMYMNKHTRAVYFAKRQHANNPDMIAYFGELPPVHPTLGLCVVPQDDLGPAFAALTDDEIRPKTMTKPVKEAKEEKVELVTEEIEKIADAIGDLKQFDFTSVGLPKVDKLSLAVGFTVNGKQRDEAFALYLEKKDILED